MPAPLGGPGSPMPGYGQPGIVGIPQPQQAASSQDETGSYEGVNYRIDHRDSNTILTLFLQNGYSVKSRPNSMVSMGGTVQMSGQFKVSFKNLLSTDQISQASYTGPGEVTVAPEIWGDIRAIRLDGQQVWYLGHHAYLASTNAVQWTAKSQGWKKSLFSGDGMFVAQVTGQGLLFIQALGAVVEKRLGPGEQVVVDRGHLVAWNCQYNMEKLQNTGGFMARVASGDWFVARFTGPGTVFLQTRNPEHIIEWISAHLPNNN